MKQQPRKPLSQEFASGMIALIDGKIKEKDNATTRKSTRSSTSSEEADGAGEVGSSDKA
jgi:hypothetical protein